MTEYYAPNSRELAEEVAIDTPYQIEVTPTGMLVSIDGGIASVNSQFGETTLVMTWTGDPTLVGSEVVHERGLLRDLVRRRAHLVAHDPGHSLLDRRVRHRFTLLWYLVWRNGVADSGGPHGESAVYD